MTLNTKNSHTSLNSSEINASHNSKRFDNEASSIEVKEKWYYVCSPVNQCNPVAFPPYVQSWHERLQCDLSDFHRNPMR